MFPLDKDPNIVKNEQSANGSVSGCIAEYAAPILDTFEIARFWSRVEVRKADQCWPWRFGTDDAGYGDFRLNNGSHCISSRAAYRIAKGGIEQGILIRHSCDNPPCCNPAHLIKGDHEANVADRVERDRSARGEENGRSKLTEFDVRLIRKSPLSEQYFARRFEVSVAAIQDVRARKTWTHVE